MLFVKFTHPVIFSVFSSKFSESFERNHMFFLKRVLYKLYINNRHTRVTYSIIFENFKNIDDLTEDMIIELNNVTWLHHTWVFS